MSQPVCPVCQEKSNDWLSCKRCTDRLMAQIAEIPSLVADLRITHTRQSKFGSGGVRSGESPVPFDDRARALIREAGNTVTTWMRVLDAGDLTYEVEVCSCKPYRACRPVIRVESHAGNTIAGWCDWLGQRRQRIRGMDGIEQLASEVDSWVRRVRRVIDRPTDLTFVGTCPVCQGWLYAKADQEEIICQACKRAGIVELTSYSVEASREGMREQMEDQLVTVAQCAILLASFGLGVKADTVHNWARPERGGRLVKRGEDREGRALYRVGDVADLVRDTAARKAQVKDKPKGGTRRGHAVVA